MMHLSELCSISNDDKLLASIPFVDGALQLLDGQVSVFQGDVKEVFSPIYLREEYGDLTSKRIIIGKVAQMKPTDAIKAVEAAQQAWNSGQGEWPQSKMIHRVNCVESFVEALKLKRETIISTLMWEICKTEKDAASEFDRFFLFYSL